MTAIAKALSRVSGTQVDIETPKTIAFFVESAWACRWSQPAMASVWAQDFSNGGAFRPSAANSRSVSGV